MICRWDLKKNQFCHLIFRYFFLNIKMWPGTGRYKTSITKYKKKEFPTKFELYEKNMEHFGFLKLKIKIFIYNSWKLVHHVLVFLVCNSFFFFNRFFFFFLVVVNINILPCKQAKQRNKVDLMSMNFLFFHWQSHFYIKILFLNQNQSMDYKFFFSFIF